VRQIPESEWAVYFKYRDSMSRKDACQRAGINKTTAWRAETQPDYNFLGRKHLEEWRKRNPGSITLQDGLSTQAKRALNDFAYFRLRYFGRKSTPWQVHAANQVLAALETAQETLDPQYIVINVSPGAGKSQLFGHDIPAWLICRDRSVTIFIGSASVDRAADQTEELLTTFERQAVPEVNRKQRLRGAVKPESFLVQDFGRFKPDNGRNWKINAFKVSQENNTASVGKEATVAAVGKDSNYLGLRPDIVVWDDLVNEETSGTAESRERTKRKYQREAEPRVELGGVMILQGQRQFPEDLYHDCINARGGDENDPDSRKYKHIVYKAHYEEHCRGDHGKDAQPYDPADPENSGCLLDPVGVSWHRLTEVRLADERDGTQNYRIVYQQEDGDPSMALVNPLWIEGGEDKKTGERFPGCWETGSTTWSGVCGLVPKVQGEATSILSVDSSPSKFWACGWWLHHPQSERRFLVDLERRKMKVTDAVAYNKDTGVWSGLFEDWWWSAKRQGRPITWLIFEAVAAEKYFLDSPDLLDWARLRGVHVIKHDTHRNKTNPEYGMQILGPVYRLGRVRLPGDVASGSKGKVMQLVREVTRWPEASTEDCAMMQWFVEHNLAKLAPKRVDIPAQRRPSWLSSLPDGRGLQLVASR
jgi:hypothetical protein